MTSYLERASDWLNPILVKETRQALKSRQFVATFFLMLTAAWLISVFGILLEGPGVEHREAGGRFFFFFYIVLAVAIFLVVPFGAFRSLLSERDLHTWEVLSITTLKPRQIVWGKLTSAVVQLFIYYSAITPFIAFANLLGGIDVPTIAFVLTASLFWSLTLTLAALTASTVGNQRAWQVFLTLGVLGGLLMGTGMSISWVSTFFTGFVDRIPFGEPGFWWFIAVAASYLFAYCLLFLQIAVAQLTFDADNRSTGIRLAAAGIFWMSLAWMVVPLALGGTLGLPAWAGSLFDGMAKSFTAAAAIHWGAVGLFAVTESDILSRRVRRDLTNWGLFRVVASPFLPGGSRGLVYIVAHLSALVLFVCLFLPQFATLDNTTLYFAAALWCYLVIYLGLGAAIGRWARKLFGEFRPAHGRVLIVLGVAMGAIAPHALSVIDSIRTAPQVTPVFYVSDPMSTLYRIVEGNAQTVLLVTILGIAAATALVINLRAMLAGVSDVAREYVPHAPAPPREAAAMAT